MQIIVDGKPFAPTLPPQPTLQALIEATRDAGGARTIVVGVRMDGQELAQDQIVDHLAAPVADGLHVEFETANAATVAADALQAAAQQLAQLGTELPELGQALAAGQAEHAVKGVAAFVSSWQRVHQVIVAASQLLGEDLTEAPLGEQRVGVQLQDLLGQLAAVRDALAAEDMVTLADLTQYELPGVCETWCNVLSDLERHARAKADGA